LVSRLPLEARSRKCEVRWVEFSQQIPYLKRIPADGRIRLLLTFFDAGVWHFYRPLQGTQFLTFVQLISSLVSILRSIPRDQRTSNFHFLPSSFNIFLRSSTFSAFEKLHDDLENALAALHKYLLLSKYFRENGGDPALRVVATELEYSLFNSRSAYDLLHGVAISFATEKTVKLDGEIDATDQHEFPDETIFHPHTEP
jgi:hypothetical protein